MMKKMGAMTLGIAAGLVVTAPFASASESHHGHESEPRCSSTAGDASAVSDIGGDSLQNTVTQAPVGGANIGNCSNITVVDFGDSFEFPAPELPSSEF